MYLNNLAVNKKNEYIETVDGLRAIAVLVVLFFHLEISFFKGGFIGVDLFFVISGFLITKLLANEMLETGKISFGKFYIRRIRRLFPALLFTILLTMIFSYYFLIPDHFETFSASVIFSIFSVSNIYFWLNSGYFDINSDLKPLLNTWSLSVEEQFYIFWPLTMMIIYRYLSKTNRKFAFFAIFFISFMLNIFFTDNFLSKNIILSIPEFKNYFLANQTIFYLLPFRIFEFMIGSFVFLARNRQSNNIILNESMTILGIIFIIYSCFTIKNSQIFPSYNALLPCFAAALIIHSKNDGFFGNILRFKPLVQCGIISYSLYLIHWPLIVFYKYWKFSPLTSIDKVLLTFLSIIFAIGMYLFIEKPFRHGSYAMMHWSKLKYASAAATISIAISSLAFCFWMSAGIPSRYANILTTEARNEENKFAFQTRDACRIENLLTSACDQSKPNKIIVLGDSHSPAWMFALNSIATADTQHILLSYLYCHEKFQFTEDSVKSEETTANCNGKADFLTTNKKLLSEVKTVILASYRPFEYEANLNRFDLINHIRRNNKNINIVVLGNYFQTRQNEPCLTIIMRTNDINSCMDKKFQDYVGTENVVKNEKYFSKFSDFKYKFVDITTIICPNLKNCPATADNVPFMFDSDHLTYHFTRMIVNQIAKKDPALSELLGISSR